MSSPTTITATLTDLSYKIAATQELMDNQNDICKDHQKAWARHYKNMNTNLDGPRDFQVVAKQMEQDLALQKAMVEAKDELVVLGRQMIRLLEERQEIINTIVS